MPYNPRVLELHTDEQLRAEMVHIGAEPSALGERVARGTFRLLKLEGVPLALARLLYQELEMEGGQVVTAARLDHVGPGATDMLLCATRYQFEHLLTRLRWQGSEELQVLAGELEGVLENGRPPAPRAITLGPKRFDWGTRTYVMGILNLTPDSFSGDGLIRPGDRPSDTVRRALEQARRLAAAGADILDIGGESTHPGAPAVDAATEAARVLPVIEALAQESDLPLSVDTYKAEVARAALEAGAHLVNDVWGLRRDPELGRVIAERGAAVVINHNWHNWLDGAPRRRRSADFIGDIMDELRAQLETAREAGILAERMLIDPGLGFGKSPEQSLELLDRLAEFRVLGAPLLIGPSRKGFIRRVLGAEDEALEAGTAAALAIGIARGADVVRVHNVQEMARVARMTDAILGKSRRAGPP